MGNSDTIKKIYLVCEFFNNIEEDILLKSGPFFLDGVTWNDGSDNI